MSKSNTNRRKVRSSAVFGFPKSFDLSHIQNMYVRSGLRTCISSLTLNFSVSSSCHAISSPFFSGKNGKFITYNRPWRGLGLVGAAREEESRKSRAGECPPRPLSLPNLGRPGPGRGQRAGSCAGLPVRCLANAPPCSLRLTGCGQGPVCTWRLGRKADCCGQDGRRRRAR